MIWTSGKNLKKKKPKNAKKIGAKYLNVLTLDIKPSNPVLFEDKLAHSVIHKMI